MRDIKTLLEVLLDQYLHHKDDNVRDNGLCYAIKVLHEPHAVFTIDERTILMSFIYDHRPDKAAGVDDFWWEMGYMHPRVKFLEQLIDRL